MRGVRAIEEEHADEKEKDQTEASENHPRLAQAAIVEIHQGEHSHDAESEAEKLTNQETIAAAALLTGGYRRGAEHHEGAGEAKRDGDAEELAIGLNRARHFSPRLSSLRRWAALWPYFFRPDARRAL